LRPKHSLTSWITEASAWMRNLRLGLRDPSGNAESFSRAPVGFTHMGNRVEGIVLVPILLLALCPFPAFSKQEPQQSQTPVVQFGAPRTTVNPPPIPPDARQPDRLLQGATISTTITALAFSPDGKWLAWGGYDNTIMIWNAATGAEERKLGGCRANQESNAVYHARVLSHFACGRQRCILLKSHVGRILARDTGQYKCVCRY
jgi:WD40 repeat protein